mmetsp:Transcript_19420/g.34617  ORF Transcript_19420/g.34617 Transcript_19420/m.34617 type:complete len:249 (-) Transcript_19420:519-1265(-)
MLEIASKVVIATCGVSGAGICSGLGLTPGADFIASAHPLPLAAAKDCEPLFDGTPTAQAPIFVTNYASAEGSGPVLSVIVVNATLNGEAVNAVAHELVSQLPAGAEVWVTTSSQVVFERRQGSVAPADAIHAALFGEMQLPECLSTGGVEVLPDSARPQDAFLSALLHFLQAMHFPCCCLIIPDQRNSDAMQSRKEHAERLAGALHSVLQPLVQLSLASMPVAQAVSFTALHAGDAQRDSGGGDVMYM